MAPKDDSEARLLRALTDGLAEDVLSPDFPIEEVDRRLRDAGGNPAEIARRGVELVAGLQKKRRLAWQDEAKKVRDAMQAKLAKRAPVGGLPRAELLARIEAARHDPRLRGDLATAARNLIAGDPSDEALRQLVEDFEGLALLRSSDEDGDT